MIPVEVLVDRATPREAFVWGTFSLTLLHILMAGMTKLIGDTDTSITSNSSSRRTTARAFDAVTTLQIARSIKVHTVPFLHSYIPRFSDSLRCLRLLSLA